MKRTIAALALLPVLLLTRPATAADEAYPVTTAPLERARVQATVEAYGRVAERPHYLYFEVAGNLALLHADVGDEVSAGQLLAELDTRDIDNQLSQAEEQVNHTRIKYQQYRQLKSREAASRDQLEDRRHDYELAQLDLANLKELRTKHELHAPVAGRVVDRLVDFPGPVATSTAIFQLRSAAYPPLVSVDLTQREVAAVQVGDRARVALPETPGLELHGKVTRIRAGSLSDGLFSVDLTLDPPPDGVHLQDGMQVEATIAAGEAHAGYAVPITALLSIDGDSGRFFVVADGKAKSVTAHLSRIVGDRVLLADDLSAYARVVVRGQYQLTDGAPLRETPVGAK
ncbi:efflux RND transporter periplasmic adaptor subunit [Endothiovibrio diazotrophicus]